MAERTLAEGIKVIWQGEGLDPQGLGFDRDERDLPINAATARSMRAGIGRPLVNFVVKDPAGKVMTRFDPPITLQVPYTQADLDRAKSKGKSLMLFFWQNGSWKPFNKSLHNFHLVEAGGYGEVSISDWGDPQIGWGP